MPGKRQYIASAMLERIRGGEWSIGDPLPRAFDLKHQYGVAQSTMNDALRILHQAGYIQVRQGTRTVVLRVPGADEGLDAISSITRAASDLQEALVTAILAVRAAGGGDLVIRITVDQNGASAA